jgi:O-antigen/teichoic acid export membrane protein
VRNKLKALLPKSAILKNTTILVSGTALAQLIPILLQPFLRRQFEPDVFGAYAVYLSLLGIFVVITSFKYELAIVLPHKDKTAANIFFLALFLNIIFNSILLLIIITWKFEFLHFLNLPPRYSFYLYMIPLGTFFFSTYQNINYWLIRKKAFLSISINKTIRRSIEGIGQTSFAFIKNPSGLIFGDLIGHIANISYGTFKAIKNGLSFNYLSWNKIKYISAKYSEFPKYNVIPSVMSAASYLLPTIFINKFFSSEYTGFFDLSKLVLSIPLALIATSISNVLLQRISEKFKSNESFIKELIPIIILILFICIIEIGTITLFGKELFNFVFGKKSSFSGEISKILVWSYAFNFFIASFSSLFISMKKIKLLSIWQVFYFISILLLYFFKEYSFTQFLNLYVRIEIINYFIVLLLLIYIILQFERKIKINAVK